MSQFDYKKKRSGLRPRHDAALGPSRRRAALIVLALCIAAAGLFWWLRPFRGPETLLNVSYDASREYFVAINRAFSEHAQNSGKQIEVRMSHAGSVRQARAVAGGHMADVIALGSDYDLDHVTSRIGCVAESWRESFPHDSSPFHSGISFIARNGNPKRVSDWSDLLRADVEVALPSPRASGAGRWAYLALLTEISALHPGNPEQSRTKFAELLLRAELIESGARQALHHFINHSEADILLTWESEALSLEGMGLSDLVAVYPHRSIRAELRVAMLTCYTQARGTEAVAVDYLQFLYSPAAQAIAAKFGLRPTQSFPAKEWRTPTKLYTIEDALGPRKQIWYEHFGDEGKFDTIVRLRHLKGRH